MKAYVKHRDGTEEVLDFYLDIPTHVNAILGRIVSKIKNPEDVIELSHRYFDEDGVLCLKVYKENLVKSILNDLENRNHLLHIEDFLGTKEAYEMDSQLRSQ